MPSLRYGKMPSKILSLAAGACLLAPVVLLSGCASDQPPSYVQGPSAQQLAAVQARKVEIEDDGQPVQPPPARAVRPEEDDPTQPWSPNYGGNRPAQTTGGRTPSAPVRSPSPYVPTQVDAAAASLLRPVLHHQDTDSAVNSASTGSLTRLSDADADTIMAQAINAQEWRRR